MSDLARRLIALAFIFFASSASGAEDVNETVAWARSNLRPMGWRMFDMGGGSYAYSRVMPAADAAGQVWVRFEYREPAHGYFRSMVELEEVNCSTRQLRTLQRTGYAGNNMEGEATTSAIQPEWLFPPPGTRSEVIIQQACTPP